jgi:predicted dehydrogenase
MDTDVTLPELQYQPTLPKNPDAIGLIGCGDVTDAHLTAYQKAGLDVVAFADIDIETACTRRDKYYPNAAVYEDHKALLEREDVRVVDVATPPEPRPPLIEDSIRAGKHVLSQKPFVLDIDEGHRLADLAEDHGVELAVNQNGRWAPHWSYLRESVTSGLLGDLMGIHCTVHWQHDGPELNEQYGRHFLLYDFAIHWFDLLATLVENRPERVMASTTQSSTQTANVDLLGEVLVEWPETQATLAFDANTPHGIQSRTYVSGTEGSFEARGPAVPWSDTTPGDRRWPWDDQQVALFVDGGAVTPDLRGSWNPDGWIGTMSELQSAVADNRKPIHDGRSNLVSLELCFAAVASSIEEEPKRVGEVKQLPD